MPFWGTVKLLGVTLDSGLTRDWNIAEVLRSCNYHICALHHIRPPLRLDAAMMIAHSVVSSRLDYANALLAAWHVCHQPQQVAGGTEPIGQGGVSSTAFCQHQGVAETTLLVASPPANNTRGSSHYIQNQNHRHSCLSLSPDSGQPTRMDTTIS